MKMNIKTALAATTLSLLMPWGLGCTQAADTANPPIAAELQTLQGSWEGVFVGEESAGKVSITIKGSSLHFQGLKPSEWYETTFMLPPTYPPQLRATIQDCAEPCEFIGKEVFAIYKIEDETLTLVGFQTTAKEPPATFGDIPGLEDNGAFRYRLKRVQPSLLRDPLKGVQPPS